jgi:DNA-cytosine methyltransferase
VNELTHLDLFSGIGGFALAAKWNGYRTLAFCDNEPYAQAVLKKHWPDVPCHQDIREVRGELYAGVTLLTGGFPCQPFSVAGKQRGKDDNRYLWPEMLRVIREAKPTWIIGENVAGIVNLALDQVCTDLEAEGYEVEPIIIPACAVDALHRRDRVWIVGYAKSNGLATSKTGRGLFNQPEEQGGQEQERELAGTGSASADVADSTGGQRGVLQNTGGQKGTQGCDELFGITGGLPRESCSADVANAISHAERSAHGKAAGGGSARTGRAE